MTQLRAQRTGQFVRWNKAGRALAGCIYPAIDEMRHSTLLGPRYRPAIAEVQGPTWYDYSILGASGAPSGD